MSTKPVGAYYLSDEARAVIKAHSRSIKAYLQAQRAQRAAEDFIRRAMRETQVPR